MKKKYYLEHQTLGWWVVWPIDPVTQHIILKIVGFQYSSPWLPDLDQNLTLKNIHPGIVAKVYFANWVQVYFNISRLFAFTVAATKISEESVMRRALELSQVAWTTINLTNTLCQPKRRNKPVPVCLTS